MECLGRISLDIPLRAFIKTLWSNLSQQGKEDVQSKQAIFKMLLTTGCDFYELLSLYAEFPLTEKMGGSHRIRSSPCQYFYHHTG